MGCSGNPKRWGETNVHTSQDVQVMQSIAPKSHVAWLGHGLQMHAKLVPDVQTQLPKVCEGAQHGVHSAKRQLLEPRSEVVLLLARHR